jgi:hypothetical protein
MGFLMGHLSRPRTGRCAAARGALRSNVFRGAAAPPWRFNPWQRAGGQSASPGGGSVVEWTRVGCAPVDESPGEGTLPVYRHCSPCGAHHCAGLTPNAVGGVAGVPLGRGPRSLTRSRWSTTSCSRSAVARRSSFSRAFINSFLAASCCSSKKRCTAWSIWVAVVSLYSRA